MTRTSIISATALMAAVTILQACSGMGYAEFNGYAQGGRYSVKVNMEGTNISAARLKDSIDHILNLVDTTFSGYNRNSILSRRNAGKPAVPNREYNELQEISEHYRKISGGAFNVAAAPLFDIWGFGFTADSLPAPERVAEAMAQCGSREKLNFNAIAQGYTCDLIGGMLRRAGARDFLVDVGEILCQGINPSGNGWSIGIDTPEDGNNSPGASMSGIWHSDGGPHGVVTSGNYRKYYIRDGKKYAHTIDPRTGYPVTHDLLSATVIAPTATEADALATWFMVVGFEEARSIVEAGHGIEACLITRDSLWTSEGFDKK